VSGWERILCHGAGMALTAAGAALAAADASGHDWVGFGFGVLIACFGLDTWLRT
jgi:hypothetical protein